MCRVGKIGMLLSGWYSGQGGQCGHGWLDEHGGYDGQDCRVDRLGTHIIKSAHPAQCPHCQPFPPILLNVAWHRRKVGQSRHSVEGGQDGQCERG